MPVFDGICLLYVQITLASLLHFLLSTQLCCQLLPRKPRETSQPWYLSPPAHLPAFIFVIHLLLENKEIKLYFSQILVSFWPASVKYNIHPLSLLKIMQSSQFKMYASYDQIGW